MPRKPDLSIVGKTYNDLKVMEYTGIKNSYNRGLYRCKCLLCDGEALATKANLLRGEIKNCGCTRHNPRKNNLIGKTFGRLYVKETTTVNNRLRYVCVCDCGNVISVRPQDLLKGNTRSCGQHNKGDTAALKKLFTDGTAPCKINNPKKLRSNNSSGFAGVWYDKSRGSWCAEIMFKCKKYHLGRFANKEQAIKARQEAEARIFGDFLDWYYKAQKEFKQ